MTLDYYIALVLDLAGYFGIFVAAIMAACVVAFLGCGLWSIVATVLGFWKGGK
jgi:hypothetical protein